MTMAAKSRAGFPRVKQHPSPITFGALEEGARATQIDTAGICAQITSGSPASLRSSAHTCAL
jgi:hypothetical protein